MKKNILLAITLLFILTSCDGWSYTVPTFPAPPPTITPSIYTPTPIIVTITNTSELPTYTMTETSTQTPIVNTSTAFPESSSATPTQTLPPLSETISVELLGCNTNIDIIHGMGEVTNAFITMKNYTGTDLTDLCATLFALDEGRIHPDKTVCISEFKHGYQVTLKLTVDSTYRQDTPIQIEVNHNESLLIRLHSPSCEDIGLLQPEPGSLLTPTSLQLR